MLVFLSATSKKGSSLLSLAARHNCTRGTLTIFWEPCPGHKNYSINLSATSAPRPLLLDLHGKYPPAVSTSWILKSLSGATNYPPASSIKKPTLITICYIHLAIHHNARTLFRTHSSNAFVAFAAMTQTSTHKLSP